MEYQSIFATPPKNEAELTALENEVQKLLLKTLDINITRKRRSEKLREVACVFAGFPNGFQQMQKYWLFIALSMAQGVVVVSAF